MPISPPPHAERKFHGQLMDLWQWQQEMYDGTTDTFECITRPDTASVLGFIDANTVLLTRQEQPHKPHPFFDLPGGRIDDGETVEDGVKRELQEESGYHADRWMEWSRKQHFGMIRMEEIFFIATSLSDGLGTHQDAGEKIELLRMSWDELIRICLRGELRNPRAAIAILSMEYEPEARQRLHDFLSGV